VSLVFDLYVSGDSWLHNLDPRVKLWTALLGIVTTFLLDSLVPQAAFLIGVHVLLRCASVPWRSLRWVWRQMAILLLFILILQPFFTPSGASLIALGPLRLTWGGVQSALLLALRTISMALITIGILFTTDQHALVRAFVGLGLPYTWGLTLSLTLRFLPTMQRLFSTVREAQSARGWLPHGNFVRRARDYIPVVVAVVIGTMRLSDQLTLALAARGLGDLHIRTVWRELSMQRRDWAVLTIVTLTFLALAVSRFSGVP